MIATLTDPGSWGTGDAAGLVAYALLTATVLCGALHVRAWALTCAGFALGFGAAHLALGALDGSLHAGPALWLAAAAGVVLAAALLMDLPTRVVDVAGFATWVLATVHLVGITGDDGPFALRAAVWAATFAVLLAVTARVLEDQLAPSEEEWTADAAPAPLRRATPAAPAPAPAPAPVAAAPAPTPAVPGTQPRPATGRLWSVDADRGWGA